MNTVSITATCGDCKQFKNISDFFNREASNNKKQPRCKICQQKRIGKWKTKKKVNALKSSGQLLIFEVS